MKISVFPQTSGTPSNWTFTTVLEPTTVGELADIITNQMYSGGIFRKNYCNAENFDSTDFIILDYDNNPGEPQLTLEQARATFAPYKHIIAPTRNHQKEKHGKPPADRYRVVLWLSAPITDADTFSATWHKVADMFPGCDPAAKDPSRRLFQSISVTSVNETGATIGPVAPATRHVPRAVSPLPEGVKGKLARSTREFLIDGAKPGEWNAKLFKAAKDHQQNNYTKEEFIAKASSITGHLDRSDLTTIESAFRKPPKHEPREPDAFPQAEVWVRQWLDTNKVKQSYETGLITVNGKQRPATILTSDLVLAAMYFAEHNPIIDEEGNEKRRAPYGQQAIEHVLQRWMLEQDEIFVGKMRQHVEADEGQGRHLISQWVQAVTGRQDPKDIAVMTHFIWQVKRKLNDQPVDHHLMPIIYGPTGSGKTRAIIELLKPIEELTVAPQDMTVLGDTREAFIFGRFYAVFFDELARADKLDVSALKNKITCRKVSYRVLGTNQQDTKINVATFIGASNNPVQAIIQDPTSARRFWQIESQERIDWETVNKLDYLSMWKSVSPDELAPVLPVLADVSAIQDEELRAKSLVEQWYVSQMEPAGDNDGLSATTAYEMFKEWCAWQNIMSQMTFASFGLEAKRLGLKKVRRNAGMMYLMRVKKKV